MAILTKQDGIEMWRSLYRKGDSKDLIKANGTLPQTTQLPSMFQVFEDLWTNNSAQMKLDIEAIIGRPISNAYLKALGKTWLRWKVGKI